MPPPGKGVSTWKDVTHLLAEEILILFQCHSITSNSKIKGKLSTVQQKKEKLLLFMSMLFILKATGSHCRRLPPPGLDLTHILSVSLRISCNILIFLKITLQNKITNIHYDALLRFKNMKSCFFEVQAHEMS